MRATLEFDLPDEAWAHRMAVGGHNYFSALKDVDEYCRSKLKHDGGLTASERAYLEEIRALIREQASDLDDDV